MYMLASCVRAVVLSAILGAFCHHALAGELSSSGRDEWWLHDLGTGANTSDVEINPVADANGFHQPGVAYAKFGAGQNIEIYYSRFDGTNWTTVNPIVISVSGLLAAYMGDISLSFKSTGSPAIAFTWSRVKVVSGQNNGGSTALLLEKSGSVWTSTTIRETGLSPIACGSNLDANRFYAVDLAYTPQNVPCIIYSGWINVSQSGVCNTTSFIEYSENRATGSVVETATGSSVSKYKNVGIDLNPLQGSDLLKPVIVYGTPGNPATWSFRQKTGSGNSFGTAEVNSGTDPDIKFKSGGTACVAFTSGAGSAYRTRQSGVWSTSQAISGSHSKPQLKIEPASETPSVIVSGGVVFTLNSSNNSWLYNGRVPNSLTSYAEPDLAIDPDTGHLYGATIDALNNHVVVGEMKRLTVSVSSSNPNTVLDQDEITYVLYDSQGTLYYDSSIFSLYPAPLYRFTHLPSGSYTLAVDAQNHYMDLITFTLEPHSMWSHHFVLEECPPGVPCW